MKVRLILAVIILAVAAGVTTAEEVQMQMPWHAPVPDVEEGAQLIAVGFWGDAVGIGLTIASGPIMSTINFGVGMAFYNIGLTSMLLVGNPCMTRGLREHHDAIVSRGYQVATDNREKSENFSRYALYCGGGAVALGLGAAVTGSTGLSIASLIVGAGGSIFEIINFYNYRPAWANDMREAVGLPPMGAAAAAK